MRKRRECVGEHFFRSAKKQRREEEEKKKNFSCCLHNRCEAFAKELTLSWWSARAFTHDDNAQRMLMSHDSSAIWETKTTFMTSCHRRRRGLERSSRELLLTALQKQSVVREDLTVDLMRPSRLFHQKQDEKTRGSSVFLVMHTKWSSDACRNVPTHNGNHFRQIIIGQHNTLITRRWRSCYSKRWMAIFVIRVPSKLNDREEWRAITYAKTHGDH